MNIKIARTLLILCIVYIVAFYVVKFIFPDFLLLQITDTNVLNFGNFIESGIVYKYIYYMVSTFLTFYLFICASRGSFKLNWKELIYLLIATALCKAVNELIPELYVHTSTSCMFLLAFLCKGKLSYSAITFTIHGFLSQFLFSIRGFETIISKINIASGFILSIECYSWMLILSLLFYLKEKKNG